MAKGTRGKQQAWAVSLSDDPAGTPKSPIAGRRTEFARNVALWIPRRFLSPAGIDVRHFILDVNEKILTRGFVQSDGQLLTTPLVDVPPAGALQPEAVPFEYGFLN